MTGTIAIPSYDEVVALSRELGPLTVPESYRDENDHMNIAHYFDLCVAATARVFDRVGITDEYRATRGAGFFTGEHHIRYHAETRIGEEISVYVRGVDRSDKVVHIMALLVNDTTRRLSCTLEVTAIHVDLRSRRAAAFAADTAAAIDRELAPAAVSWPAPVCGAMGIRR
ncbi:thioesterase family protein [Nocardia sp. NBC_01329]|uniref:thioesterase family protein n=1 Tax=Nocardia sp. NBC_01329 TaxID=2903594 RepID=UPI002E15F39F|nr:thioesterase family protein [Nocardia sp. NBC_01329]